MSRSWNVADPRAFCNIYKARVGHQNKVLHPLYGYVTEEFWLMSRNERWAALVSNNPTIPLRALRMMFNKWDNINARSEIRHAKRHDDEGWGNSKAYIRHRDRTFQRSKLIPQLLEEYARDQIVEDEWPSYDAQDQWWEVMYDLWAEEDDEWLAFALRDMDYYAAHDYARDDDWEDPWLEGEIHAPEADIEAPFTHPVSNDDFAMWAERRLNSRKFIRN